MRQSKPIGRWSPDFAMIRRHRYNRNIRNDDGGENRTCLNIGLLEGSIVRRLQIHAHAINEKIDPLRG